MTASYLAVDCRKLSYSCCSATKKMFASFALFVQLPSEIRRMIWRYTWEPRVVVIRRGESGKGSILSQIQYFAGQCRAEQANARNWHLIGVTTYTHTQVPSSFFVDYESRDETLRHYKLAFKLPLGRSQVYFRFGVDVPATPRHNVLHWRRSENISQVEDLVIMDLEIIDNYSHQIKFVDGKAEDIAHIGRIAGTDTETLMEDCPNLKRLHFVELHDEFVDFGAWADWLPFLDEHAQYLPISFDRCQPPFE